MWMSSTLTADAPANDLQFMKDMIKFQSIDPEIAQTVLQTRENHMWYLRQEIVPFPLFSSTLSDKEKQEIAAKLHASEKPYTVTFEKYFTTSKNYVVADDQQGT